MIVRALGRCRRPVDRSFDRDAVFPPPVEGIAGDGHAVAAEDVVLGAASASD
jgi:hypothetical protein